jgi:hypothetical protein
MADYVAMKVRCMHVRTDEEKGGRQAKLKTRTLFVSLVYYAESTVRWFIVREKHYWMAADSADKSKRTG